MPKPAPPKQGGRAVWGDLESRIGGRWLLWIGIIAISFGVAFFLRLAFNEWIGQRGRVAVGVLVGLGFLVAAERLRRRYPVYAYGLSGGGILILYLSGFAAFALYHMVPQPVAFVYMVAVTAMASLLSARYNALPIALLGLIGGFLTPILLSTNQDNPRALFSYIALLDLGVLALAYSKQWRVLNYLAFICTVLMFFGWWLFRYTDEKLWTAIFFLTVLFVIFALVAILYNIIHRQPTRWLDLTLVFLNGLLYFGTSYYLLKEDYHAYLGMFAVLVAAFYLSLGYFTWRRDRQDRLLLYTFLGLAFLFLALAVPIQFDQHWVTMGWAIEGAVMTWVGLKANDRTSRYAALALFVIALSHWVWIDVSDFAYRAGESFAPLINRRALSCAVLIAALAAASWLYKTSQCALEDEERGMFRSLYLLGANALGIGLLTLDANDYFDQKKALSDVNAAAISNSKHLTLSALWSVYGAMALVVGITRRLKVLRAISLALIVTTIVKVLIIDLQFYKADWHATVFNQTFAAFALLIASLAVGAMFYARSASVGDEEKSLAFALLVATANVLAVIALSFEAAGHFERAKVRLGAGAYQEIAAINNTKQLALTAVWAAYATVAWVVGLFRRSRAVRAGALGLSGLAAVKAMVVDLQFASAPWHRFIFNETFAAFAIVIAALSLIALLYTRTQTIPERERTIVIPALVCAANFLAVISLSAEINYYFERAADQAINVSYNADVLRSLEESKQFYLSALWSIYGAAALIAGIVRRIGPLRTGAIALLGLATAKLLIFDLQYSTLPGHAPLFNKTFGAFALVIAAFIASVWFYSREERISAIERSAVVFAMTLVGNILAIIALSAEANGYFQARLDALDPSNEAYGELALARQLSLSVTWALYGGAMLAYGIMRRNRLLRVMALALIGMTIAKVFFFDLASLERIYRVLSFIVLGAILLAASFLYQRLMRLAMDESAEPAAPSAGESPL
jgi:uncharacterized membrane protein